jgi:hypothetical protein
MKYPLIKSTPAVLKQRRKKNKQHCSRKDQLKSYAPASQSLASLILVLLTWKNVNGIYSAANNNKPFRIIRERRKGTRKRKISRINQLNMGKMRDGVCGELILSLENRCGNMDVGTEPQTKRNLTSVNNETLLN